MQPCPSFRCLYAQSMNVDEDSDQNLDLSSRWIRQHGYLKEAFGHMLLTPKFYELAHIFNSLPASGNFCRLLIPGPEVIKLFSCSTQLSMKFQLLIKTKIPTNKEVSCTKSLRCCIHHANKC